MGKSRGETEEDNGIPPMRAIRSTIWHWWFDWWRDVLSKKKDVLLSTEEEFSPKPLNPKEVEEGSLALVASLENSYDDYHPQNNNTRPSFGERLWVFLNGFLRFVATPFVLLFSPLELFIRWFPQWVVRKSSSIDTEKSWTVRGGGDSFHDFHNNDSNFYFAQGYRDVSPNGSGSINKNLEGKESKLESAEPVTKKKLDDLKQDVGILMLKQIGLPVLAYNNASKKFNESIDFITPDLETMMAPIMRDKNIQIFHFSDSEGTGHYMLASTEQNQLCLVDPRPEGINDDELNQRREQLSMISWDALPANHQFKDASKTTIIFDPIFSVKEHSIELVRQAPDNSSCAVFAIINGLLLGGITPEKIEQMANHLIENYNPKQNKKTTIMQELRTHFFQNSCLYGPPMDYQQYKLGSADYNVQNWVVALTLWAHKQVEFSPDFSFEAQPPRKIRNTNNK